MKAFDPQLSQSVNKSQKVQSKRFDFKQFHYQLQSLDSQNYGSWPVSIKSFLLLAVGLVTALISYLLPISSLLQQIEAEKNQQQILLQTYHLNNQKVNQLPSNVGQEQIRQQQLDWLSGLLPSADSIALTQQLNDIGLTSEVVIQELRVETEVTQGFYTEQSLGLKAMGNYYQIGRFLAGLATLPRLITLHDFEVSVLAPTNLVQANSPKLTLILEVKGYQAIKPETQPQPDDQPQMQPQTQPQPQKQLLTSNSTTQSKER